MSTIMCKEIKKQELKDSTTEDITCISDLFLSTSVLVCAHVHHYVKKVELKERTPVPI